MRPTQILVLTALATAALAPAAATADDALHLTPPLYRDQIQAARVGRAAPSTTPQPVPAPVPVAARTAPGALASAR
ncbi:hypothetical protein Q8W71_23655 [Methylobacterium sp. NEAU 140]|uniref:hypothetical protein n=1 Tax=Methylobacterium sp. NEAU 140 TaxID=3064945 RepID=UPI002734402A|nr:hypothetical protein [Methylobacterium sp. NEAU 140]MDP4025634.1 hypothetical protein [Methylobacterium sp. NEAU 140]